MTDTTMLASLVWPLRFLQASVSCVLMGLLLWAAMRFAARRWPMLASQRAVWLAAQLTIAAVFVLTLAPQSARLGILPAMRIEAAPATDAPPSPMPDEARPSAAQFAPAPAANASAGADTSFIARTSAADDAPAAGTSASVAITTQKTAQPRSPLPKGSAWISSVPLLWMLAYAAGLGYAVLRLMRARRLWRGLLALATRLTPSDLREHGAFTPQQLAQIAAQKLVVLETDATISPMLIGAWQPRLLLPRHLRDFSAAQQQLIIEHELTHLRRRDPLHLTLTCALRTILWFNPALRWLDRQLAWAQELSCDQLVLAGRPQQQRQNYAAALLRQLTTQSAALPSGGVAFGGIDSSSVAARVRQMRQTAMPSLNRAAACMLAVAMAALVTAAALLQPAFAVNDPSSATMPTTAPVPAATTNAAMPPAAAPNTAAEAWRYPLDHVRITSFYAVHRGTLPTHHGIDFAASKGTPVHAVAAGTVIAAGPLAENDGRYGNVVIIEHRGQPRSFYAHLDSTSVKVGDTVSPGQLIGAVGDTGFTTGPHLHFETREGDRKMDPQLMLAGLDQLATPLALRMRRQQLGH